MNSDLLIKKMRKAAIFYGVIFLSFIVLYSCTAIPTAVNSKKDTVIVIDGKDNDWGHSFRYDKDSKLQYALSKDDNNLYICLKAKNKTLEKKIKTFGLTLWIDTTGRRKENMGIKFPLGNKAMNIGKGSKGDKNNVEENKDFLNGSHEMEVKGFPVLKDYGNDFIRLESNSRLGIHAIINYDTLKTMIYELKIPYAIMFQGNTPENITLRFITGSVDVTTRRDQFETANAPGKVATGMNGYATGGGGNLASVPGDREYFTLMDPVELKLNIGLTTK